jgi:hypothetical protein
MASYEKVPQEYYRARAVCHLHQANETNQEKATRGLIDLQLCSGCSSCKS